MRYVSLFSGVEAASVAWEPLGWEAMAFAEIEPFPCAVLEERFSEVPNLGDVTKVDWSEFIESSGRPDLLVGGSPCQSFSVAGGRESLDGESRLMFEYIRAVQELRPRWFVWENVPGALSAKGLEGDAGGLSDSCSRSWPTAGMAWRGEYWTRSLSEYPTGWTDGSGQLHRGAGASFLSDALETRDVPQKYSLSAKACEGILRRAETRGKSLPEPLKTTLEKVVRDAATQQ